MFGKEYLMRTPSSPVLEGNRFRSLGNYLQKVRGNRPARRYHLPSENAENKSVPWFRILLWLLVIGAFGTLAIVWSLLLL